MRDKNRHKIISTLLKENGFAHVKNVFSGKDLDEVDFETKSLIKKWKSGIISGEDFWSYTDEENSRILYRIHNFEKYYPKIISLIEKPQFNDLRNEVFGTRTYPKFFALIIKMPNKGATVPWHRDIDKVSRGEIFNFSIYLDDSSPENGCLEVVAGTHKDNGEYSNIEGTPSNVLQIPALKNEIVIHDVRLLHGSGFSKSPNLRRSIVIEFNRK